jgi:leucyl aminopeptidase
VGSKALFSDYEINQNSLVEEMLKEVNEFEIRTMISKLESYHNRFYKAQTGVDSSNWIMSKWQEISAGRSDVKVEAFKHASWPQPSIILTIEGSELPNEIVIIGGHADSIAGQFGGASARAPGADDNASGVATFTEVLRVLINTNFKPKRTIQFMAYAAEEVGLLGSKAIAQKYKQDKKVVVGVMQLDMTNFHGSARKNLDIVMMTDFTNAAQNEFIGRIIDTYVKVPWGYSKCGYGCSDHASWHGQGYPASMPFESTMEDINRKIHTATDLLSNSREAIHAEKFARMGVAFLVEMAN